MRRTPSVAKILASAFGLLWALVFTPASGQQQGESDPPPLILEAVEVTPAEPGPATLCQLRVRIRNTGPEKAYSFGFAVRINDRPLPVYSKQLFMQAIDPGSPGEIQLYNFWSTETSRPLPQDGKLRVEVTLTEARWVRIETRNETEIWTPLGAVEGLPISRAITLHMHISSQ